NAGEPKEGPTVRWMKETSRRLGVWLGTSFLEAEGEDFYNTFVLTNPEGGEDGRVRKQTPATGEAFFTRGEAGQHVIHSWLGKIGVAICYENRFAYTPRNMYGQSVDILLQPHAAIALQSSRLFPQKSTEVINDFLRKVSSIYAGLLGIPVIYCNHSGQWRSPMPGIPFLKFDNPFDGFSSIANSDGSLMAQLEREEGVIVEEVILDPSLKKKVAPQTYGKWSMPDVPLSMKIWGLLEFIYAMCYRSSKQRKLRAREISVRS
ncbi:MAG: carbon-nitrogen hydrolase family protein, partial [Dehalococcoidia bacterium]